ncbi:hypothetical protein [Ligilactobacillus apodemi]|nr:hypothetical protein [Ligilactobacillus apodemi]MCR1902001.1 hypothetical protein [Ligilactobacillus apodemi]
MTYHLSENTQDNFLTIVSNASAQKPLTVYARVAQDATTHDQNVASEWER